VHENGEWKTKPIEKEGGACPPVTEEVGNHDSYQAEFIPNEKIPPNGSSINFIEPKIVSIGTDSGPANSPNEKVYARVDAGLGTVEPFKTIEANHDLTFKVPAAETFNGTARAGHSVKFKGETALSNTFLATNLKLGNELTAPSRIEYGCEKVIDQGIGSNNVTILPSEKEVVVGPVGEEVPGTEKVKTEWKCEHPYFKRAPIRIAGSKPNCGKAGVKESCGTLTKYQEKGDYIKIVGGELLTLEAGKEYVFCSLWTNGPISLSAGASNASLPVRVFIDNRESSRCSEFVPYEVELKSKEKEKVEAGSFYAGQGVGGYVGGALQTLSPTQVQIYLAGSGEADKTKFTSTASGLAQAFVLYAPQSEVNVSASTFGGALIGYDTIVSATTYTQDLGLNNYPLSNSFGVFHVAGYTQCSPSLPEPLAKGLTTNTATDLTGC
jgi:hypothetical protein